MATEKEINPYVDQDVENIDLPEASDTRSGSSVLTNVKEIQIGYGSYVFRGDQSGIWLGSAKFATAPFRVDMLGNMTATSLTLSSLSGTLDDIADGTTYKRAVQNQLTGADRAYSGFNSSSEIIKGFLNTQLSAKTLPTDGVRVDSNGIYGRKGGNTTFYISSSGDAYFSGDIVSSTLTSSSISGGTITGGTITGTTFKTQSSGQRVEFTSTLASYYNASDTLIAQTYANSTYFYINASQTTTSIRFIAGSSGSVYLEAGTSYILMNSSGIQISSDLFVSANNSYQVGSSSYRLSNVYTTTLNASSSITLNGDTITAWPSAGTTTLSGLSINTTKNWQGYGMTNVDYIDLSGVGSIFNCNSGYVDNARAFYFETGRTSNPSLSGEIRYYDGTSKGFRGYVAGFRGQFDMTAV